MAPGTLVVTVPRPDTLAVDQAAALAEFARACKGAARAVSLYPRTHPSIRTSLDRLTSAAGRLMAGGDLTVLVYPDNLLLDGRAPARPDASVAELAALLHERLVSELTIDREADADDWHAWLLLLAKSPEDLVHGGGFGKAFAATGRQHLSVREIDYAEVLRERGGRRKADWDHIIACCVADTQTLDERALNAVLDALGNPELFAELIDHLQTVAADNPQAMDARAAVLLQLLQGAMDALAARNEDPSRVLDTAAAALPRLTPGLVLALVKERTHPERGAIADSLLKRMTDASIAEFVGNTVAAENGATERLAQAFEALVPEAERKSDLLHFAEEVVRRAMPADGAFEALWQGAREMLLSYTDTTYVSAAYARELSSARQQAIEVERVSDDPPERVAAWVATVSDEAIRLQDLALLADLLRLEGDPAKWAGIVTVAVPEIERHALLGNFCGARELATVIGRELSASGRWDFSIEATKALDRLAAGPLVRHVILHLRKADEAATAELAGLCHRIGPALVHPLAEALAAEENTRCIRRLRDLLLGFGAAGRHSVEQLKSSSNPAVRRTAIDLLRVFGGTEALPELASMLGDSDPQVQRESIRAIVQIATPEAYAVLEQAIVAGGPASEAMVRELIDLRDDRTIPVLCHAVQHTRPRRKLVPLHVSVVEALGGLQPCSESTETLQRMLYAGDWWAPLRTAALRRAAAVALRRLGTGEATAILQEAAECASRGVRAAARGEAAAAARRDRERA